MAGDRYILRGNEEGGILQKDCEIQERKLCELTRESREKSAASACAYEKRGRPHPWPFFFRTKSDQ